MLVVAGILVAGATCSPSPPAAAPAELGAPSAVLAWGEGPGQPGLRTGVPEEAPYGPTALAVDAGAIYVADPVHRQVLVIGGAWSVTEVLPTPFRPADLVALPGGTLLALDERRDRLQRREADGAWRAEPLDAKVRPAYLAVGAEGEGWLVDRMGRARLATAGGTGSAGERAAPLGAGVPWHATGRLISTTRAEVLVWQWDRGAELKAPGPALRRTIETPARLGMVRPLGGDAAGGLAVLSETLSGAPLKVEAQVSWLDAGGVLRHRAAWSLASLAPANRYAALAPDGTIVVMQSRPSGLHLWRLGGAR